MSHPRGKKARALKDGLAKSRSIYTVFPDAYVVLRGDEIEITQQVLEGVDGKDPVDFAASVYGNPLRPNPFPIFGFASGWLESVFRKERQLRSALFEANRLSQPPKPAMWPTVAGFILKAIPGDVIRDAIVGGGKAILANRGSAGEDQPVLETKRP